MQADGPDGADQVAVKLPPSEERAAYVAASDGLQLLGSAEQGVDPTALEGPARGLPAQGRTDSVSRTEPGTASAAREADQTNPEVQ